MDTHTLELKDTRLSADIAPQCTLQVILGQESISMLAADTPGEVLALQSWSFSDTGRSADELGWDLRRVLRDEPLFALPYGRVICALEHHQTTLVPRRLFQHGALANYFKLLLPPGEYTYTYDELSELDAYLVYASNAAQIKLLYEFFPHARHRHLAASLLRYWRQAAGDQEHRMFLNLRHQSAQLAVFERQNLLFYNAFSFPSASDLLYFVLLAYEQFRLRPADIPLVVSGTILSDSELYRVLYRFIREIQFAPAPTHFKIADDTQVLPGHCHVDLFCLKNL
ncbi:MAG: DUF3822 family protein [Saprospiraceae bacterium]|nr:DUF3822 family protein [Saprospiraceae bacterium]